ncbi:baseplate wedge subunit [Vibrio phage K356]|nr:hypothetical protein MYOV002v2_p0078 [Vibrio phage 144E46.1]
MLEHFPQRWFTDKDGDQILMTNLCRRVAIPKEFKDNAALYMAYSIKDGESARDIAARLYDDPDLFWVIYMVNDIHDIMSQWPIQSQQLQEQLIKKYGLAGLDEISHYTDPNGLITDIHAMKLRHGDMSMTTADVVSYYSLKAHTVESNEHSINDMKRSIKLIDPDHTSRFKAQIEEILNE